MQRQNRAARQRCRTVLLHQLERLAHAHEAQVCAGDSPCEKDGARQPISWSVYRLACPIGLKRRGVRLNHVEFVLHNTGDTNRQNTSPWTVTLTKSFSWLCQKKDGSGGLAGGTWAACPGLARGRCARGAGGGSCVGVVAHVAWCVCGSRWFSVLSLVGGLQPVGSGSLRPGRAREAAAEGERATLHARVFSRACYCWRCVRGVRVSGLGSLPLGHGDCSVPMNL